MMLYMSFTKCPLPSLACCYLSHFQWFFCHKKSRKTFTGNNHTESGTTYSPLELRPKCQRTDVNWEGCGQIVV